MMKNRVRVGDQGFGPATSFETSGQLEREREREREQRRQEHVGD
jgi:hypothetical protein